MPSYDYECDECNHRFEEIQKFSDEPLTECPECKKNKLRRLFGCGAGFIFKGSGFYQTDYANKTPSPSNYKRIADNINGENKT